MVRYINPGLRKLVRFSGMSKCSCAGSDRRWRVRLSFPHHNSIQKERSERCPAAPGSIQEGLGWSAHICHSLTAQKAGIDWKWYWKAPEMNFHFSFILGFVFCFFFHFSLFSSRGWNLISLLANQSWLSLLLASFFLQDTLSADSTDTTLSNWLSNLCIVTKACCHPRNYGAGAFPSGPLHPKKCPQPWWPY